ncbi:MAG: hypothetical protein QM775_21070 [Pirellulales bacterium]
MVTIIDILSSGRENAHLWLSENRASDGYADISNSDWETSLAVIDGVELDRVRLTGRTIFPNVVNSKIIESEFSTVTTDGHFWGGGNMWQRSSFSASLLRSVISPQNLFVDCIFKDVVFDGYVACETLFESCQFLNCKFESLRTKPKRNNRWAISQMAGLGSSLQFVSCEFDRSEFHHCVFSDSAFKSSKLVGITASECDFTNINSDCKWWSDSAQGDVFVSYLNEVLAEITLQLGPNSSAAKALSTYKVGYVQGDNKSKDYSACLYDGNVPDRELEVVEDIFDQLGPRYGL